MSLPPQPHSFLLHHQDPHAGPQMFRALSGPRTLPPTASSALSPTAFCLLTSHRSAVLLQHPRPDWPPTPAQPCALPQVASFTPRSCCPLSVFLPFWAFLGGCALLSSAFSASGRMPGMEQWCKWTQPSLSGLVSPCLSSPLNPESSPAPHPSKPKLLRERSQEEMETRKERQRCECNSSLFPFTLSLSWVF